MKSRSKTVAGVSFAVAAACVVTCSRERPSTAAPIAAPSAAPPPAAPSALTAEQLSAVLPRVDTSSLTPAQRAGLLEVATDTFCYCGCPHTLAGCLKDHNACGHAPRAAALATKALADGVGSGLVIAQLEGYYASFPNEHRQHPSEEGCVFRGNPKAPITVVEFSDYQCPHCAAVAPLLDDVVTKQFVGKVKLCSKYFPLPMHPRAQIAAQAAEYVHQKYPDKFWAFHAALFAHQESLEDGDLKKIAAGVGIKGDELLKHMNENRYADVVNKTKAEATALKVPATPALFLNGRYLVLKPTPDLLTHTIEDEIEWNEHHGWKPD